MLEPVVEAFKKAREERPDRLTFIQVAKFVVTDDANGLAVHFGPFQYKQHWSYTNYDHVNILGGQHRPFPIGGAAIDLFVTSSEATLCVLGESVDFGPIVAEVAREVGQRIQALLSEQMGVTLTLKEPSLGLD